MGSCVVRGREIANVLGHILLSLIITVLCVFPLSFAVWVFMPPGHEGDPITGLLVAGFVVVLLVSQWHRRVRVKTRLSAVLIGLAILAAGALVVIGLTAISRDIAMGITVATLSLATIGTLIALGTIELPWPVPVSALWRGEIGLARTYWVWGTLVTTAIFAPIVYICAAVYYATDSLFLPAVSTGFGFIVTLFFAVAVWRSARHYSGTPINKVLARASSIFAVVLIASKLAGLIADVTWVKAMQFDPRAVQNAEIDYFKNVLGLNK